MNISELLKGIDKLKEELDRLDPLSPEIEKKLWEKFRLEWTYNSNHIEGITLTYDEVKALLILGDAPGNHTMREYEETKAHNVAIIKVREYAEDKERLLMATELRGLNKILLVEPFWKTSPKQETRKWIVPGRYKKEPNHVLLPNGEIFSYASPEETPGLMEELMNFVAAHDRSTDSHPVWLAAMAHYKLVRIHPFDDGNGRTARLLMNYILLKNGFPPVIIKTENQENYRIALRKADAGDEESFVSYIIDQLRWSLNKFIGAAKGEPVEELGDVDKEIDIFDKQLEAKNITVKVFRDNFVVWNIYKEGLKELFEKFNDKLGAFDKWFTETKKTIDLNNNTISSGDIGTVLLQKAEEAALGAQGPQGPRILDDVDSITLHYTLISFIKSGTISFNTDVSLRVEFQKNTYRIKSSKTPPEQIENLYDRYLTSEEIGQFIEKIQKRGIK